MFYLLDILTGIAGAATGGSSCGRRCCASPARGRRGCGRRGRRRRGRGRQRHGRMARADHRRGTGRTGRRGVGFPLAPAAPAPRRAPHALDTPQLAQEVSRLTISCSSVVRAMTAMTYLLNYRITHVLKSNFCFTCF